MKPLILAPLQSKCELYRIRIDHGHVAVVVGDQLILRERLLWRPRLFALSPARRHCQALERASRSIIVRRRAPASAIAPRCLRSVIARLTVSKDKAR